VDQHPLGEACSKEDHALSANNAGLAAVVVLEKQS
jgi:hypothetical protein